MESMERSADADETSRRCRSWRCSNCWTCRDRTSPDVIVAVLLIWPEGALGDVFTEMVKLVSDFVFERRGGAGDRAAGADGRRRALEECRRCVRARRRSCRTAAYR